MADKDPVAMHFPGAVSGPGRMPRAAPLVCQSALGGHALRRIKGLDELALDLEAIREHYQSRVEKSPDGHFRKKLADFTRHVALVSELRKEATR